MAAATATTLRSAIQLGVDSRAALPPASQEETVTGVTTIATAATTGELEPLRSSARVSDRIANRMGASGERRQQQQQNGPALVGRDVGGGGSNSRATEGGNKLEGERCLAESTGGWGRSTNEPRASELSAWLSRELKNRLDVGSHKTTTATSGRNDQHSGPTNSDALIYSWPERRHEQRNLILDIDNSQQRKQGRSTEFSASLAAVSSRTRETGTSELREESASNRVVPTSTLALGRQSEGSSQQPKLVAQSSAASTRKDRIEGANRVSAAKETEDLSNVKHSLRLPTFGGIPRKLSRLPYFSYYGKTRNVDLVSAEDRERATQAKSDRYSKRRELEAQAASGSSGESSSRGSQASSPVSRIPTLTKRSSAIEATSPTDRPGGRNQLIENDDELDLRPRRRESSGRINWRGYSNISNLFPYRSAAASRGQEQLRRRQASSLSNLGLGADQQGGGKRRVSVAGGQNYASRSQLNQLSPSGEANQSHRSSLSRLQSPSGKADDLLTGAGMRRQNRPAGGASYRQQMNRTLGSYQRGRAPAPGSFHLGKHHRSPSASSLYHSSGIGLSPYGPPILDPDCPVHGYSPTGTPQAGGMSKSSTNLAAGSEANLLYPENPYLANYYDTRGPQRQRAASLYSPNSPTSPPFGSYRSVANAPPQYGTSNRYGSSGAYYNSSSRFSLYHPTESGPRAHLAPTSEQLRRILGYQPPGKPVHLHPQWAYSRPFIHLQGGRSPSPLRMMDGGHEGDEFGGALKYEVYNQLQDAQAIRAVDFHPSGEVYAVGSNSRALRICAYPADHELRHFSLDQHEAGAPRVLFKFLQVHRGSIYCVGFNGSGQLLATGSNDQTVHIVRYNPTTHSPDGDEYRLTMHDGTVRDLCFIDDSAGGSSLLLSAGGGDNKIYVTDCDTISPFQSMAGHTHMVMALSHVAGASFVSASHDKTIRFWDLRTRGCTSIVSAPPSYGTAGNWVGPGAPVCSVQVEPTGRLLASGHSDSTCMLYDIRSAKIIQTFRPHDDEIRTISFSPKSYYLLTGGYDGRVVLSDLQGDLAQPLPSTCVAEGDDKIVQAKWHPSDFTFATTSADKTATLWALPME